jgi:hypothetical protein
VRECIPDKKVTIRPNDEPWFDSMLRKTICIRNQLRQKAIKSKKEKHWADYRKAKVR